ncbi:DUF5133 domain-containing protein [Kitasatospora sp. NPDC058190]|uniref:DUF5133 domain-containing protein n=1 Tax=Kitasatospora sp. NPDC058190 TaxID=3346371 RepID=UPI0036D7D22A
MPLIDFSALCALVAEADALTRDSRVRTSEGGRRLADVHYTICVYTGLRDPMQAVEQARGLLRAHQDSLLESDGSSRPSGPCIPA